MAIEDPTNSLHYFFIFILAHTQRWGHTFWTIEKLPKLLPTF